MLFSSLAINSVFLALSFDISEDFGCGGGSSSAGFGIDLHSVFT